LLTGGAAAAASLVAGAAIGAGIEKIQEISSVGTAGATDWSSTLVNEGQGTWHFVTTLADLKDQAVRFVTDTIIGYVIRNDGDDPGDPAPVVAVSAACTHMGCIVQWQDSDRKFHCPCHGGLFTEYGKTDTGSPIRYLKPLPRLKTRVDEAGKVFVEVPKSAQSPKVTSWSESR
jgi:nitrite reductase/ring-hydroxylating ferredoxin subunit